MVYQIDRLRSNLYLYTNETQTSSTYFQIGMLSLGYPKVNFQVANNRCHDQLIQYVQEALDSVDDEIEAIESRPSSPSSKEQAFQVSHQL